MAHPVVITADVGAFSVMAATIIGWLPPVAAFLSIVYLSIQIAISIDGWLAKKRYARGPKGEPGPQGQRGPMGEKGDTSPHKVIVIKPPE